MLVAQVKSGFRTLTHARPQETGFRFPRARISPDSFPGAGAGAAEERWSFEAAVGQVDAVFLVLEQDGRSSRWMPMDRSREGRWTLMIGLTAGKRRAKLYAQQGTTLVHCDGADLVIRPPVSADGSVRVEAGPMAWSA